MGKETKIGVQEWGGREVSDMASGERHTVLIRIDYSGVHENSQEGFLQSVRQFERSTKENLYPGLCTFKWSHYRVQGETYSPGPRETDSSQEV